MPGGMSMRACWAPRLPDWGSAGNSSTSSTSATPGSAESTVEMSNARTARPKGHPSPSGSAVLRGQVPEERLQRRLLHRLGPDVRSGRHPARRP